MNKWAVKVDVKGFDMLLIVEGTENAMWKYMDYEFHNKFGYVRIGEEEYQRLRRFGVKAYIA